MFDVLVGHFCGSAVHEAINFWLLKFYVLSTPLICVAFDLYYLWSFSYCDIFLSFFCRFVLIIDGVQCLWIKWFDRWDMPTTHSPQRPRSCIPFKPPTSRRLTQIQRAPPRRINRPLKHIKRILQLTLVPAMTLLLARPILWCFQINIGYNWMFFKLIQSLLLVLSKQLIWIIFEFLWWIHLF